MGINRKAQQGGTGGELMRKNNETKNQEREGSHCWHDESK